MLCRKLFPHANLGWVDVRKPAESGAFRVYDRRECIGPGRAGGDGWCAASVTFDVSDQIGSENVW